MGLPLNTTGIVLAIESASPAGVLLPAPASLSPYTARFFFSLNTLTPPFPSLLHPARLVCAAAAAAAAATAAATAAAAAAARCAAQRTYHPIDFVEKRKGRSRIEAEARKDEVRARRYRPPHVRATGTDMERKRLQNTFQFKGGKALPAEMLPEPIKGHLPLSMQSGRPTKPFVRPGGRGPMPVAKAPAPPTKLDKAQKEFDYLVGEVEDRRKFLEEMQDAGKDDEVKVIKGQIQRLVKEMSELDAKMAAGADAGDDPGTRK